MATVPTPRISEEEYLRQERAAETKSEFVAGEMFAMSGGSRAHSALAMRWGAEISNKLRGRNCIVYSSDLKIRTHRSGSYVYPDISVVCEEPQPNRNADDFLTNPIVVIEVLSPSTAEYDRGKKFALYREIPSLQDYILVHTDSVLVEHYSRQPENWLLRKSSGLDSSVHISSIDCIVDLNDVYRNVF